VSLIKNRDDYFNGGQETITPNQSHTEIHVHRYTTFQILVEFFKAGSPLAAATADIF